RSTSGTRLLDDDGMIALRQELLPIATVLTPNVAEAGVLLGGSPPDTVADMRVAALALGRLGPQWVLVTGGHLPTGDQCVDVLAGPDGVLELVVRRVAAGVTHGTGCA